MKKVNFGKLLEESLVGAAFLVFIGWLLNLFVGNFGIGFLVPIADFVDALKAYIGMTIGIFLADWLRSLIGW